MQTYVRRFIIVCAVALSFILLPSKPTFAAPYYYLSYTGGFNSATCSNTSFFVNVNYAWNLPPTGTNPAGFDFYPGGAHGGSYPYAAGFSTGTVVIGTYSFANTAYPYTVTEAISTVAGGTTYSASITLMCSGSNQVSVVNTTSLPPQPFLSNGALPLPPVFFDPGDIRVDGQPGDRVAVYCPSDKQIQVIGIGANGKGAGVAVFNPKAVIAAGKPGLSAPLRSYKDPKVDLGIVSIQMMLNDGVTSIYIAWNGGILNATGQGDFKKQFVTPIRFCPFTFR